MPDLSYHDALLRRGGLSDADPSGEIIVDEPVWDGSPP